MDKYNIMICGDNILEGTMQLTKDEIQTFCKIVYALKPDGKFVPSIIVRNLTEEERRLKQLQEQKRQEALEHERQFEEECSHLGKYSIGDKFPNLMEMLT